MRRTLTPWLGAAIRERRQATGLSQEALAEKARLHRTYIGMVERAERNVSVDKLDQIATALAVRASALLLQAERKRATRSRP
jgi:transcriptional regulator with XRE-family HTH domain